VLAAVPVSGDKLAMPAEDGIRSDDGGKFVEQLAAEDLAFDGEPTSLALVEEYLFLSELLPEYVILSEEVLDGVLLPAVDPASEDQEQQMPRLKLRFHVPPDARLRSGASGIVGHVSSADIGSVYPVASGTSTPGALDTEAHSAQEISTIEGERPRQEKP
jgi:hypothetical protein